MQLASANTHARFSPRLTSPAWAGLAVLLGLIAGWVPVTISSSLIGLVALLLAVLVEPALAVLLMLSLAPLKTLLATESPLPLPVDIGQLTFALVVGTWAIWKVTRQHYTSMPGTPLYWALAGIMLAFIPSLFNAASTAAWVSEILKWIEMAVLVLVVLDVGSGGSPLSAPASRRGETEIQASESGIDYSPRWHWIAFGVVLAAVLQAVIGLYEYLGGSGAPHLWIDYVHFRAFGTFGQPNPFSGFIGLSLSLTLGLAWGYAWETFNRWRDPAQPVADCAIPALLALMYAGFGLVLLGGLLVAWGRGAWLGSGAAGVVMVFLAFRQRWIGALLVTMGALLILTLWSAGLVPTTVQLRIDNALDEFIGFRDVRGVPISDENFAIVERLAHWQAAINMMNDQPFIGVGLGNYEVVYSDYSVPSWPRPLGHAHNDYLNLLAETGLIGLAGYLAGWSAIVWWTLRALQQPDPIMRGMVLGLMGTWTHLAVHSVVDKLYVNNIFLHIGVMLGLLAVAYRHHQNPLAEL